MTGTPLRDIRVQDEGTIILLCALSGEGQEWLDSNLPDDAPRLGSNICVERRYARDIVSGMLADGILIDVLL